jgi:hypothetical protein
MISYARREVITICTIHIAKAKRKINQISNKNENEQDNERTSSNNRNDVDRRRSLRIKERQQRLALPTIIMENHNSPNLVNSTSAAAPPDSVW